MADRAYRLTFRGYSEGEYVQRLVDACEGATPLFAEVGITHVFTADERDIALQIARQSAEEVAREEGMYGTVTLEWGDLDGKEFHPVGEPIFREVREPEASKALVWEMDRKEK